MLETPPKPDWLKSMFPWEQKSLAVNGRRMAYVDEGGRAAPIVLLLHGNPTWGFLYRDFVEPLKTQGYRVIVPDCIGAGYSSKPRMDTAYSLAHHIADLVSLIDQLELNAIAIVGQDWGGPQGIGAALQRLSRVKALVLMNTWCFTDYVGPFHQSPRPWTTWHAPLIGPIFQKRFKALSHGGPSTISKRRMRSEEKRGYHHIFDEPDSETVVLTWPRSIPLQEADRGWADMRAIEARIPDLREIPTQIVWGVDDPVFNLEYRDRLMQLFPHAEGPVNFARASHFLQDDRGADIVKTIIPFLARVTRP
ncbi:MAG TPA: alpha/beta fold hydrolase [Rhizomicrobium sp.]|jgi:pimeloyl-ACP methyl ester carboxylesterase|nr:alpha/beta fold hydrolase [Rhizomicrobium sp.]